MASLFKRDLAAQIRKATDDSAALSQKLLQLQQGRDAVLVSGDDAAIEKHDQLIAATERQVSVTQDRIRALDLELKREYRAGIEKRRAEAVAKLEHKMKARQKLAADVEAAVKHLGDVWSRLLESRSTILQDWPSDLFPFPRQDEMRSRIDREMSWALWSAGKPNWATGCNLPAPSNEGLGITGVTVQGVENAIKLEHTNLLARLTSQPIADMSEAAA